MKKANSRQPLSYGIGRFSEMLPSVIAYEVGVRSSLFTVRDKLERVTSTGEAPRKAIHSQELLESGAVSSRAEIA
jgi:hypothetical protein